MSRQGDARLFAWLELKVCFRSVFCFTRFPVTAVDCKSALWMAKMLTQTENKLPKIYFDEHERRFLEGLSDQAKSHERQGQSGNILGIHFMSTDKFTAFLHILAFFNPTNKRNKQRERESKNIESGFEKCCLERLRTDCESYVARHLWCNKTTGNFCNVTNCFCFFHWTWHVTPSCSILRQII